MTGMVGTALYVSPEVQGNTKATYNQVIIQTQLSTSVQLVVIELCRKILQYYIYPSSSLILNSVVTAVNL